MSRVEMLKKIEKLFYNGSFDSVSMQDVANEIGIKKPSLYHYFSSKDDMISQVLDQSFNDYLSFTQTIISRWQENDNFSKLLREFLDFPIKNQNIFGLINQKGYEVSLDSSLDLDKKQKEIFDTIYEGVSKDIDFSIEKTYLFLKLINTLGQNDGGYDLVELDDQKLFIEIENLFFS